MAKPEWGSKRICHSCGARFYDLHHDPIVCPKCGTAFDPEALLRSRRSRGPAVAELALSKPAPKSKAGAGKIAEVEVGAPEEVDEIEIAGEDIADEESDLEKIEAGEEEFEEEEVEEDDQSDVLLEDASELGDDDVDNVIDLSEDDEEAR